MGAVSSVVTFYYRTAGVKAMAVRFQFRAAACRPQGQESWPIRHRGCTIRGNVPQPHTSLHQRPRLENLAYLSAARFVHNISSRSISAKKALEEVAHRCAFATAAAAAALGHSSVFLNCVGSLAWLMHENE